MQWGIQWSFAHNGEVPKFTSTCGANTTHPTLGCTNCHDLCYNPVGETDSEAVFCAILNALKAEFNSLPTLPVLHETIKRLCNEIINGEEDSTIFNFLLGCGPYTLFAFSWPGSRPGSKVWNGLHYIIREPPFSSAKLIDADYSIDFSKVTSSTDRVAVIATKPLTSEEGWKEFKKGELIMFDYGNPYRAPGECERVEQQGRGLCTKAFVKKEMRLSTSLPQDPSPLAQMLAGANACFDSTRPSQVGCEWWT
jgi:glutamine amidotransferase